jgi:glutathione S-transferase
LPDDCYIKLYADYSLGYSNGALPPGRERSALDMSVPLESRPLPLRRV